MVKITSMPSSRLAPAIIALFLLCSLLSGLTPSSVMAGARFQAPGKVIVIVPSAKIRSGPGSNYPSVRWANKGDTFDVYEVSPDEQWLRIDPVESHWIAALQVEWVSQEAPLPAEPAQVAPVEQALPSPPQPAPTEQGDPEIAAPVVPGEVWQPELSTRENLSRTWQAFLEYGVPLLRGWLNRETLSRWLSPLVFAIRSNVFLLAGFAILAGNLVISLFSFRLRWFFGEIVFLLFLGPIGLLFGFYITLLILTGNDRIKESSPRDIFDEALSSGFVLGFAIILFIALTAVSILGGIIVMGILFLYVQLVRALLPGDQQPRFQREVVASTSSDASYSYSSSSASDQDDSSYDPDPYDDDRYRYDDDDDGRKGSPWDGWLVKW